MARILSNAQIALLAVFGISVAVGIAYSVFMINYLSKPRKIYPSYNLHQKILELKNNQSYTPKDVFYEASSMFELERENLFRDKYTILDQSKSSNFPTTNRSNSTAEMHQNDLPDTMYEYLKMAENIAVVMPVSECTGKTKDRDCRDSPQQEIAILLDGVLTQQLEYVGKNPNESFSTEITWFSSNLKVGTYIHTEYHRGGSEGTFMNYVNNRFRENEYILRIDPNDEQFVNVYSVPFITNKSTKRRRSSDEDVVAKTYNSTFTQISTVLTDASEKSIDFVILMVPRKTADNTNYDSVKNATYDAANKFVNVFKKIIIAP